MFPGRGVGLRAVMSSLLQERRGELVTHPG